tara:strand:- start:15278 stop:16240 length:963 start_codon:yes stop_codon:yes gene_type:complete
MFEYLLNKIEKSHFLDEPFRMIYIEDFFSESHFQKIISSKEIDLPGSKDDYEMFEHLFNAGYKIISFPGCITDKNKYISSRIKKKKIKKHSACESSGMALRLYPKDPFLVKLNNFFKSKDFEETLSKKLALTLDKVNFDIGIQKYLDGYEISPHPDTRAKAGTFMINVNYGADSENLNFHTHYLKFKEDKKYLKVFWEGNPNLDRQWVPWDWCETSFIQNRNNSIVIFAPDNNSLHAVKASYNHLNFSRTQIFGNIWFKNAVTDSTPYWEELELPVRRFKKRILLNRAKSFIPENLIKFAKTKFSKNKKYSTENLYKSKG